MAEHQPTHIENEEWRDIPGWEGMYEVSDQGRVRSLDRVTVDKIGRSRLYKGRILKGGNTRKGYPSVILQRPGKRHAAAVHTYILNAFVGPRPDGMEARHLNGVNTDNRLVNLRWGTSDENVNDQVLHGTHPWNKTHCPRGHALSGNNVFPSLRKKNWRGCRACGNARNFIRRRPNEEHDFNAIANHYYEKQEIENAQPIEGG